MSDRWKLGLVAVVAIVLVAAAVAREPDPAPSAPVDAGVASPTPAVQPTPTPTVVPTPPALTGTVAEVVDGDTIRVELPSGLETVRIIGIDTPEVYHPTEPEACFGVESTVFATELLDGEVVSLELDPTQDERDRFDRLLAHVHLGDTLYAEMAIAGGYGTHYVYDRPSVYAAALDAAEATARATDSGIWGRCQGRVDLPLGAAVPPPLPFVDEPVATTAAGCHPSYDPCVPDVGYDLDCGDIGFRVTVIGTDEYRLDGSDNDGLGYESY